jgi:glycosyltransferase involved in cell wall biosynthesis
VIVMRVKPRISGTNLQMEPGLVSVMMPAYNAERYISQAIESVLTQSYPRWELIVVNDGSTDATARIAASFGDPRIHLIEQANGGEASARNTALRHMRGEFVAFLDADDEYLPHHLEATAGFLLDNPLYDAVYSDGYFCDEARTLLRTLASRRLKPSSGRIYDQVVRASCMLGPPVCVVLRRNIIEQYDLAFDTAITIGPDWDFLTRCADVGQFAYIDRQTCLYRLHQANISSSVRSARRAADLAKCRQKAIRSPSFNHCSAGTRVAVFDDLLLNLLLGRARRAGTSYAMDRVRRSACFGAGTPIAADGEQGAGVRRRRPARSGMAAAIPDSATVAELRYVPFHSLRSKSGAMQASLTHQNLPSTRSTHRGAFCRLEADAPDSLTNTPGVFRACHF